jgi:hypothetical protein
MDLPELGQDQRPRGGAEAACVECTHGVRGRPVVGAPRRPCTVAPVSNGRPEPDPAEALELRDELLIACREVLLGVGTPQASVLIGHIDALLDLDDERSPGSQR